MVERHVSVAPRDPTAEPVCLLSRDQAARRKVNVLDLLEESVAEEPRRDGIEYRFAAKPEIWQRVRTFIDEEGECCPFLAFEALEEDDAIVLRLIRPEESRA